MYEGWVYQNILELWKMKYDKSSECSRWYAIFYMKNAIYNSEEQRVNASSGACENPVIHYLEESKRYAEEAVVRLTSQYESYKSQLRDCQGVRVSKEMMAFHKLLIMASY